MKDVVNIESYMIVKCLKIYLYKCNNYDMMYM